MPRKLTFKQHEQLIKDYATGNYTQKDLRKLYKTSGISWYVNNIPDETAQTWDNNLYHDLFSKIDTEEKAYWLGFLLSDGNVDGFAKRITLGVHIKDEEIIDNFITFTNTHNKKIYRPKEQLVTVSVCSHQLWNDLVTLGITPKKTFTVKFPIIPDHLISHMIRGIFDGDGCITKSKNNKGDFRASIAGTYDVVTNCREYIFLGETKCVHKKKTIWEFRKGGRNNVKKFYDYLYKDATIYLTRKKKRFEELLDL